MGVGFSDTFPYVRSSLSLPNSKPDKKAISDTIREKSMNEKEWQEIKNIPMDYGKIEKIEIKPKGKGWEWFISIPGRLAASGYCQTLDSAIDRVKQMTEEHWKEEHATL